MRWVETVALPGVMAESIEHQHLLRAMDAMVEHRNDVDKILSALLRPLVDRDLAVVFYDMTTIRTEGLSNQPDDVRHFGMSKEGGGARQVMLGVVQTADGLPLYHEVFDGHTAEVATLKPILEKIVQRFPVKRVIAVADRGLMSTDNLAELQAIKLPDGGALEFILAVPGRRYGKFVELLSPMHAMHCVHATQEALAETRWNGLRLGSLPMIRRRPERPVSNATHSTSPRHSRRHPPGRRAHLDHRRTGRHPVRADRQETNP